jgi:adenylylsulfate reductase subunit B
VPPVIDKDVCVKCWTCVDICPTDVLHKASADQPPEIRYPEECWHCNACKLDCPSQGIALRIPLPAMLLYTNAFSAAQKNREA